MADLQAMLGKDGDDARLVSFSVDPENDTPAVLAKYAASAHADPARWTFVTGNAEDVKEAVVRGFKMSAAKIARDADEYEVLHGEWFVLTDANGNVRGYYPTGTQEEMATLVHDLRRLERERR
jgi:protein SCO1